MAEKKIERRGMNSPLQVDRRKDPEPDWNKNQLEFQTAIAPIGRERLAWKDPEKCLAQLNERMVLYIQCCDKYCKKVGNLTCYNALGVSRQDVDAIMHGTFYHKITPEVLQFFKDVKAFCATYREGLASDGKINPVTAIFWQKNFDGLKDQQEMVMAVHDAPREQSFEQLESKYSKLIVADATEID